MNKDQFVQGVFTGVANRYDLMNDLMSLGIHRFWKKEFVSYIPADSKISLVDVAGGTCDITGLFLKKNAFYSDVTVCDKNPSMLKIGRDKIMNEGFIPRHNVKFVEADAHNMPFEDNSFDCYTVAFGIRNMSNISLVLKEAYRILRPCGKFLCLEFSNVENKYFSKIYDWYSVNVIPNIGRIVANNKESYEYLVNSIREFPEADKFLEMITDVGFQFAKYKKITFGVVSIHWAYKV